MAFEGHRFSLPALVASVAMLAASVALAADEPDPRSDAIAKIDPWVLSHTVAGQPAEFIVVMAEQADLSPAERLTTKLEKGRFVRDALYAKAQTTQASLIDWLRLRGIDYQSFYIVNAIRVTGTIENAEEIASRAEVARVEGNPTILNFEVEGEMSTKDAAGNRQLAPQAIEPGIINIRAPEVWAMGFTGQGIVIGGADTGVQWDHPALINHYRGWNGVVADHNYNWHDSVHSSGGFCLGNSPEPCDDNNHGTHTIGTAVGADATNTNQIGVAPGAKFIACRNMDTGEGTPARYIECMEWFLAPYPIGGTPAQGDPAKAPDLTTNSWQCPASEGCAPATLQAAVEAQRAAGIMFVAGAGNGGPGCSTVSDPPSHYDAAYTVGAYNAATNTLANFSSRGPVTVDGSNRLKPDITAPGVLIRSAVRGGFYSSSFSGTSMATPHVAGAIALLWSAVPPLRNRIDQTENVLNEAAIDVSSIECSSTGSPNNLNGWGRLDIKAAVDLGPLAVEPPTPGAGAGLWLGAALPTPSHHTSLLRFRLPQSGAVDFAIFSITGQRLRTLMLGPNTAGEHTIRWDGLTDRGAAMPPGVYLVWLQSRDERASRLLIWLGP